MFLSASGCVRDVSQDPEAPEDAFAFGLHEFTMVRSGGLSMASGLVIHSNVSQIPMSNPP